jgi:hypothetical protein
MIGWEGWRERIGDGNGGRELRGEGNEICDSLGSEK